VGILALEFPPVSHLVEWPDIGFGLNKVGLIYIFALIATTILFVRGGKRSLVPKRVSQNISELAVEFVDDQIIMQTIGPDGRKFMPFLMTMFMFIFFSNITEILPFIQFPANARMALPIMLALMVWVIYNTVGVIKQGPFGYLKNSLFPPGVPKALYILVTPIEFVSTFLVRPFSLAVRLFANMMAGHLLLVTFAVLCAALWSKTFLVSVIAIAFPVLVGLTAFEILVAFLQAFIFTILTAVYIGGAMHPEH
jgi:F-type H+-transporting ATPase subunit a